MTDEPVVEDVETTTVEEGTPTEGDGVAEGPLASFAGRLRGDVASLDRELAEIDMLVQQATAEASRHETKRAAAADRIGTLTGRADPGELAEANAQLLTLTRRATVMEAQVEVLAGKQKVLRRYRDALEGYAGEVEALEHSGAEAGGGSMGLPASDGTASPAVGRLVLGAQEDLRRDISRAMHDGPAQGLTNIVLQAQIVDRLMTRDAEAANTELHQLIAMVQATLDATKTFIFDVRPMVLDDLGLVPTLRRAAHERGSAAHIPVEFDSTGADRRLSMELESGLFRMVDEAVVGFLGGRPDRVTVTLDWSDGVRAEVVSIRTGKEASATPANKEKKGRFGRGKDHEKEELPPALATMIEEQRVAAALASAPTPLPVNVWRGIQERAASIGVAATLSPDGAELTLVATPPPAK